MLQFQSRTHLSTLPTAMTPVPLAGDEAYQEPEAPSLPAAIVTILPCWLILSATTAAEEELQPSGPPIDIVRMSMPSSTPRRNASTRTVYSECFSQEIK